MFIDPTNYRELLSYERGSLLGLGVRNSRKCVVITTKPCRKRLHSVRETTPLLISISFTYKKQNFITTRRKRTTCGLRQFPLSDRGT